MNAIKLYRVERWLYLHKMAIGAKMIRALIYLLHNSFIPYTADIGEGTTFGYKGIGVVVHSNAVIGKNCLISQNVTIGGREGHKNVPVIGDNVKLCAGSMVLGEVVLGNNVIVGANAVVLHDMPDNSVCAGVPAKILKYVKDVNE